MNPVYKEDATKPIQDIIAAMEARSESKNPSWVMDRKKELIQKMKEDTDNKEYPIMLNGLMILLITTCLYHVIINQMYFLIGVIIVAMAVYFLVMKKIRQAIIKLQDDRKNIDEYMYDGYLIKDTRLTAVKFIFLIFFPVLCFLLYRIIEDTSLTLPWWQYLVSAVIISSVAWFMFFSDDQSNLENLESEINGLIALESTDS